MEKVLLLWCIFLYCYLMIGKKMKEKRERKTFLNRVDKIESIRLKEYENAGILNKYIHIPIKKLRE